MDKSELVLSNIREAGELLESIRAFVDSAFSEKPNPEWINFQKSIEQYHSLLIAALSGRSQEGLPLEPKDVKAVWAPIASAWGILEQIKDSHKSATLLFDEMEQLVFYSWPLLGIDSSHLDHWCHEDYLEVFASTSQFLSDVGSGRADDAMALKYIDQYIRMFNANSKIKSIIADFEARQETYNWCFNVSVADEPLPLNDLQVNISRTPAKDQVTESVDIVVKDYNLLKTMPALDDDLKQAVVESNDDIIKLQTISGALKTAELTDQTVVQIQRLASAILTSLGEVLDDEPYWESMPELFPDEEASNYKFSRVSYELFLLQGSFLREHCWDDRITKDRFLGLSGWQEWMDEDDIDSLRDSLKTAGDIIEIETRYNTAMLAQELPRSIYLHADMFHQ